MLVGAVVFAAASGGPDVVTYDGSYALLDEVDSAYESSLTLSLDGGPLLAWTAGRALGAALVVLGLLVLAALGGWSLGRRTAEAPVAREVR